MTDHLLSRQDVQEALSTAFLCAVAARAHYATSEKDFDRDGVDLTVEAGAAFRPKIDFQIKATQRLNQIDDEYAFACPVKNYNKLRIQTQTPRLLLVFRMPENEGEWLQINDDETLIRHCGYWLSLKGFPETDRSETVTVRIPASNRLTVESLMELMELSPTGEI